MRKYLLATAAMSLFMSTAAFAQLEGNGYYRVKNTLSNRYVSILHNKSNTEVMSGKAELGALRSFVSWDKVCSDPSTIVYFDKTGTGTVANKPCKFFKTKNGKNYRCHAPSQLACEHFERKEN